MTRFFDILFCSLGLIILSPVFLILAILVKLNSKGPFIYKQKRVGKDGKEFNLLKVRTMHVNSDKKGLLLTVGHRDPRITKLGRTLRKYKLDELPQLWNVLIGEMSIVGPRPEVKKYVDLYTPEQRRILSVRPGVTDIASVEYRNENTLLAKQANPEKFYIEHIMPKKIELNHVFIEDPTIGNYFRIIFKTIYSIANKSYVG
jgi:lipopolysaccharide/colanic/teichoic acid biosynthesis glycosyltransferase